MTLSLVLSLCLVYTANAYYPPEQVHLALGVTPDCMTFNWVTFDDPIVTNTSVQYSSNSSNPSKFTSISTISNGTTLFIDSGTLHTTRTIHVITVCNLKSNTKYYYQVGDSFYGWSDVFSFKTMPDAADLADMISSNIPQKFVMYGDMGDVNAQTLSMVTQEGLSNEIDMILHIGDFAYDFDDENGTVGDDYMRDISVLSSHVAYMVCPGNHESAYNFSHYTERFRGMPQPQLIPNGDVWTYAGRAPNNWFFSWNVGLVHFVSISTEIYYYFPWLVSTQYAWLVSDLTAANANRSAAPWVIVNGHRPVYSSANENYKELRLGVQAQNGSYLYGLDSLFYQFGVDFYFCGHVHNYQRLYDIYNNKTTQSTTNMPATTYVITGSAGCDEDHTGLGTTYPYDAFKTQAYSYTRFYVYNDTHARLEQVVSDNTLPANMSGAVIDSVWYVQENHGPFASKIISAVEAEHAQAGGGEVEVVRKRSENRTVPLHGEFDVLKFERKGLLRFGKNHAQRREEEEMCEIKVEYLGDDKELYREVKGVYF